jgi:hypothetical protein
LSAASEKAPAIAAPRPQENAKHENAHFASAPPHVKRNLSIVYVSAGSARLAAGAGRRDVFIASRLGPRAKAAIRVASCA